MVQTVKKAVFPVAGLGTRFLPATKAMPKEMLTVVDKPIIQYAVEEAVKAGIEEFIFVTGRGKETIENHFDRSYELEQTLLERDKKELYDIVTEIIPKSARIFYTRQGEALGLGHAVHCAKAIVGNEPFAVLLPDDIIYSEGKNALSEMIDLYEETQKSVTLTMQVPDEHRHRYGIVDIDSQKGRAVSAKGFVEKPKENAPSNLACVGRYIFTPEIMTLLENTTAGAGGEIQLTDAMDTLLGMQGFNAWVLNGRRFDCGDKAGMQMANFFFAMQRPEIESELKRFIGELGYSQQFTTNISSSSSDQFTQVVPTVTTEEEGVRN